MPMRPPATMTRQRHPAPGQHAGDGERHQQRREGIRPRVRRELQQRYREDTDHAAPMTPLTAALSQGAIP